MEDIAILPSSDLLTRAQCWWPHFEQLPTFDKLVRHRKKPPILWHYTNAAGLQGIVTSGKFHATDVFFLNDSLEIKYGIFLAIDACKKFCDRDPIVVKLLEFLQGQLIDWHFGGRCGLDAKGAVCFCEKGDLLSQWRGYAEFGSGYSIGFSPSELFEASPRPELLPILYSREDQDALLEELILTCCDLRTETEGEPRSDLEVLPIALFNRLLFLCTFFKQEVFSEEQEWRLVFGPPDAQPCSGFRPRRDGLVPYYEMALRPQNGNLPVTEVITGPGLEYSREVYSVKLLFKKLGSLEPKIVPSRVSLRP